jgi:hypothetical protein
LVAFNTFGYRIFWVFRDDSPQQTWHPSVNIMSNFLNEKAALVAAAKNIL